MYELKNSEIYITDLGDGSSEVDLLFGADYCEQIMTGRVNQLSNGLTATETQLDWIILGRSNRNQSPENSIAMNVVSMHANDMGAGDNCIYNNIFHQWETEDFIEEVELNSQKSAYYLPHRGVIKSEITTTPVKPVFDAS